MIPRIRSSFGQSTERATSLSDDNPLQSVTRACVLSRVPNRKINCMKRTILLTTVITAALSAFVLAAADRVNEDKLQRGTDLLETKGDAQGASKFFEEASRSLDRNVAARALLYLGDCRHKLGQQEASKPYE